MIKWLHHLFNPHCEHCEDELREQMICPSCEILKAEIANKEYANQQLMKSLLEMVNPRVIQLEKEETTPPLPLTNRLSWPARKQLLEQEDRRKAQVLNEKRKEMSELKESASKSVEELEKELSIEDEPAS